MSNGKSTPTDPPPATRKRRDIRERMETAVLESWQTLEDEDLAIFTIRNADGKPFPEFDTGQYTQLAFWDQPSDDPRPRQLSIASSPLHLDELEFYVILVRDSIGDGSDRPGVFTGTLWGHKPGDEILYMGRPAGRFTLSRTTQPQIVCIATGTGLAPFVSMARTAWIKYQTTGIVDRPLTIMHGVSYTSQLGYRAELEAMAADPDFGLVYIPSVSRPNGDPGYDTTVCKGRANDLIRLHYGEPMSGRIEPWFSNNVADILTERLAPEKSAVYICGNPDMIADARTTLSSIGFTSEGRDAQVITEDYW